MFRYMEYRTPVRYDRRNTFIDEDSDRSAVMETRDELFFYALKVLHLLFPWYSNSPAGFPGNEANSRDANCWMQDENTFFDMQVRTAVVSRSGVTQVPGPHWGDGIQNALVSTAHPECRSLHNTIKNNWAALFPAGRIHSVADQKLLWDLYFDFHYSITRQESSHAVYAGHVTASMFHAQLHSRPSVVAVHRYPLHATTMGPWYWGLFGDIATEERATGGFYADGTPIFETIPAIVGGIPDDDRCHNDREYFTRLYAQQRQNMLSGWSLTNVRMREHIQQLYDANAMQFPYRSETHWNALRDAIHLSIRQRMYMETGIPFAVLARMQESDFHNRLGTTGLFFHPIPFLSFAVQPPGKNEVKPVPRLEWVPYVVGVQRLSKQDPPFQFVAGNRVERGSLRSNGTRDPNTRNGWTRTGFRYFKMQGESLARKVPVASLGGPPQDHFPFGQFACQDHDDAFPRQGLRVPPWVPPWVPPGAAPWRLLPRQPRAMMLRWLLFWLLTVWTLMMTPVWL